MRIGRKREKLKNQNTISGGRDFLIRLNRKESLDAAIVLILALL